MTEQRIEITSKYIVDGVIDDITSRRGLRHAWDDIDYEIQEEIKDDLKNMIVAALNGDFN